MTPSPPTRLEGNPASLVAQIITDLQIVADLQLRLTLANATRELQRRCLALSITASGASMLGLSAILASMSLVYLLHWLTYSPSNTTEQLPLWGCFAIVASAMALIGVTLIWLGVRSLRKCSHLAPNNVPKE